MKTEFPKYLVNGEASCIVKDQDEEKAARAKGFAMAGEVAAEPAKTTQAPAAEGGKKRGAKTTQAPAAE